LPDTSAEPRWRESLPDDCPPDDASVMDNQVARRLVSKTPVVDDHFHSHAALGRPRPPKVCSCGWASCSVVELSEKGRAFLNRVRKTPRYKGKDAFAVHVNVGPHAGVGRMDKKKHIHLWMYADFDPVEAVTKVESMP